jgi:ribonuclease P protein component
MLAQKNRISKELFKSIGNQGTSLHSNLFSVRVTTSKDAIVRASFVVSKKVAPRAVLRNRLRRRGYEIVRVLYPTLRPLQFFFSLKKRLPQQHKQTLKIKLS